MQTKTTPVRKHKRRAAVLCVILAAVIALAAAFFIYTSVYYRADDSVWDTAESYPVTIERRDGYIAITPDSGAPTVGYVFYPGGKVAAEAYLPYLAGVAAEGYYCVLLEVPFRLAIFDTNAAAGPIADAPGVTAWAVGGHSLGGVAASGFAEKNAGRVQGLVLLAAYPTGDLSHSGLRVASVTATEDKVLNRQKYEEAGAKLPPSTEFVPIEGGNHGQFGMYGPQGGDGEATISPEAQREQVTQATVRLLGGL